MRRRSWLLYPAWIAVCALLFFVLRSVPDPARRSDRILSNEAATRALRALPASYKGYQVVHVAYAPRGEGGDRARWVVLCDREPHSALRDALVVELDARDGALLTIRKPVN